jgi:hypothetical protein
MAVLPVSPPFGCASMMEMNDSPSRKWRAARRDSYPSAGFEELKISICAITHPSDIAALSEYALSNPARPNTPGRPALPR